MTDRAERTGNNTYEGNMEYLVTMTTRVPSDVSPGEVADVRQREAAHTHDLAREGRVLRLWRPPVGPGEWRTIGLFVAADPGDLEQTLASMPLRVWRSDDVTPLGPHPNDPGCGRTVLDPSDTEFLTTLVLTIPSGTAPDRIRTVTGQEAVRARDLAEQGRLLRLWTLPDHGHSLGDWQAPDDAAMRGLLRSLPMSDWLAVETVPVARHPNDPATGSVAE